MADGRTAVLARVSGRVQGVGFRAWARDEALALGLAGWVRNEPDGAVRALLVGQDAQVARMLDALRRGPPAARVTSVTSAPAAAADAPPGFRITG